jgi:protein phosphatase
MVVADGMGGSGGGEHASRLALETLLYLVRRFGRWNLRISHRVANEIMQRAERFYRQVDSALIHQSQGSGPLHTTLTATFGAGRDLFFAHVGHSRAYLFRKGNMLRLTRDHTIGRYQRTKVPIGPLIQVNANVRDLEHILTDTIGMSGAAGPLIDLERLQLEDKDTVLVCTNGLTDLVDEEVIGEVLGSPRTPDEISQALVELAMAMGGEDDATALVAKYDIPDGDVATG